MSRNQGIIIAIIAVALLLFAPEILATLGFAIGSVIEFAISLIISLAVVGLVFFLVMTIFGSVLLGLGAALVALIFTGIGLFWPLLLCVLILYFVFRNPRKTV